MNTSNQQSGSWYRRLGALIIACNVIGCANRDPQVFASPEEAVNALVTAVRAQDADQLFKIAGADSEDVLQSGDEVADAQRRKEFLELYDKKHQLVSDDADSRTLVIGPADWPFPVPIVRVDKGWIFDVEAGREEILCRRIGENELSAIQVCKAIGDAQREYAMRDIDKDGVPEYAQQFASDEGKRNGLYWPAKAGEEPSPLGEFAAAASAEGYRRREEGPTPYHGYYYRILKVQGPGAAGGAVDYVVNGKMILGFAVVAYPAEYDNSGIMTFIMGPDGVVYQKDLGENTAKIAGEMKAFDPSDGWKKVE
jgi:hypothetical protein